MIDMVFTLTTETLRTITKETGQPDMTAQAIVLLLTVATQKETTMARLSEETGLTSSSISRYVAKLSRGMTPVDKGYDLLEASDDPWNRRIKIVRLTPRGDALMKKLDDTVGARLSAYVSRKAVAK